MGLLERIARRLKGEDDLPRFADLRNGGCLRPATRSSLWPPVILIVGVLALLVALRLVMAPRVVAQTAACAADGCPAPDASSPR